MKECILINNNWHLPGEDCEVVKIVTFKRTYLVTVKRKPQKGIKYHEEEKLSGETI